MNHRARGIRLEYCVQDYFCDRGFTCIRSAGSHGPVDIVAIRPGLVIFCQAKISKDALGSKEWSALYNLAMDANAVPVLAYRPSMRTIAFSRLLGPRRLHERMTGLLERYEP